MPTKEQVLAQLTKVKDPEISLDVVALGLVYGVTVADGVVHVILTMTSPMCPLGETLVGDTKKALSELPGVKAVEVEITFEPPWDTSRMSEAAKAELGII